MILRGSRFGWFFVLVLACASCTRPQSSQPTAASVVNLAIWSNYVSPELLAEFEKSTGIKVQVSNYSSNEELLAKLQAGASGYDVVVPSDYMVFAMAKLGVIQSLDRSKLPNFSNLDPAYLHKQFDADNRFSVPYDWGTTGIAVNHDLYKGKLASWKDLFGTADLAGKFTVLDDVREAMGAALHSLGLSINTKNPDDLKKAQAVLIKIRSRVKAFNSETLMPLVNGETAVAHAYSSDALQARRKSGGKVDYIVPSDGCTLWIDNLVIPAKAPHLEAAHRFINFLLDPKSVSSTVAAILVAPANLAAVQLLSAELQKDPMLFPPKDSLKNCEMIQDVGETLELWDKAWTEVKASKS